MDLGRDIRLYKKATLAFYEYSENNLPSDGMLFDDICHVLQLHRRICNEAYAQALEAYGTKTF
jgi:hypothetical protein